MTVFTLDIPDAIIGRITAARAAFNATLPQVKDQDGNLTENPDCFLTDDDYFAARAISMVQSWANQGGVFEAAPFPAAAIVRRF